MSNFPVLNFVDFIAAEGEVLMTDSLKVAAVHGKYHHHVLAMIRQRVSESGKWGLTNFRESSYVNEQSKSQPMFTMTKDGYQFLVGKLTGKKAIEHQIAFIEAFNAMAAYLKNQREGLQYQYFRKEIEFKNKKESVSCAAKKMRNWQDEKPKLESDMEKILDTMQPSLLAN